MNINFFGNFKIAVFTALIVLTISILSTALFAQNNKISNRKIVPSVETPDIFYADDNAIFALVNDERTQRGLNRLSWANDLARIARDYSGKMASEEFFGHFDSDGQSVVERAKAAKLKHWSKIGENLFSVEGLDKFDTFTVTKWMDSPTHRDNILDKDWTTTGVGIAKSEDGEIFITQLFIKR